MNYIIFGGSGFIGTHLIHLLKNECVKPGDRIEIRFGERSQSVEVLSVAEPLKKEDAASMFKLI